MKVSLVLVLLGLFSLGCAGLFHLCIADYTEEDLKDPLVLALYNKIVGYKNISIWLAAAFMFVAIPPLVLKL